MSKLIIHADKDTTRTSCMGDFCVGHFYVELQGDGLDEGIFAQFYKSPTGSVYIGFNPSNNDMIGYITDEYRHRKIDVLGVPSGIVSKEIALTPQQFSSLKIGVQNAINNYGIYNPFINNCIDFVQSMYLASARTGSFVENYFTSTELETLGGAGYFAEHIGTRTVIKSIAHSTLNTLADLTVEANQYLNNRIFTDSSGTEYHMVQNEVDTLTVPNPNIAGAYVTKPLVVGTEAADALLADSNVIFANSGDDVVTIAATSSRNTIDGGDGVDTLSYANAVSGVDVDLSAGNIITGNGASQVVDTIINVEAIAGTDHNDAFRGTLGANSQVSFAGGKGDDRYDLYSSDQTSYSITDSEGSNILKINGQQLTGTASPVTNREEGTTFTLKSQDENLYVLTRVNEGGVVSSEGMHL